MGRLASALDKVGVRSGDTVGVLDWDSNRFLEAFFAVPMMGAVLQTVNVRLSPEQITYTINHAGASILLVNDEFVELLEGLRPQLAKVKTCLAWRRLNRLRTSSRWSSMICPAGLLRVKIGCAVWRSQQPNRHELLCIYLGPCHIDPT